MFQVKCTFHQMIGVLPSYEILILRFIHQIFLQGFLDELLSKVQAISANRMGTAQWTCTWEENAKSVDLKSANLLVWKKKVSGSMKQDFDLLIEQCLFTSSSYSTNLQNLWDCQGCGLSSIFMRVWPSCASINPTSSVFQNLRLVEVG